MILKGKVRGQIEVLIEGSPAEMAELLAPNGSWRAHYTNEDGGEVRLVATYVGNEDEEATSHLAGVVSREKKRMRNPAAHHIANVTRVMKDLIARGEMHVQELSKKHGYAVPQALTRAIYSTLHLLKIGGAPSDYYNRVSTKEGKVWQANKATTKLLRALEKHAGK